MAIFVSAALALKSQEKSSRAVCLQLIVFYFSVSTRLPRVSKDLVSSLGMKAGREWSRTLSWNDTWLWWFHMVSRENSDSLPDSVIHHLFIKCDIWPDLCICVWDKRTVMGFWEFLVQEGSLMSKPQNTVHVRSCATGLCAQGTETQQTIPDSTWRDCRQEAEQGWCWSWDLRREVGMWVGRLWWGCSRWRSLGVQMHANLDEHSV